MGLSIALFGVVLLLARDQRKRALAESALAESLGFRKAMEDSLSTGLRARDLRGVITYVNPAFCAMVGFSAEEMLALELTRSAHYLPPYWPPEFADAYRQRARQRLANDDRARRDQREGFETVFMRKNGERFPVMIYEAPLVDGHGRQTGWMSSVLDLSAQRHVEEVSRQQQDRLQAAARLATVGEMASLMSHELNQPLAAIASYASGSLNLLAEPDATTPSLLKQAMERIAEQAERAGRVIKSVHSFVRRREQLHETLTGGTADRRRAAAGAHAGAQEQRPHRNRPAAARQQAAARALRQHDGGASAAEPGAQRPAGDGTERRHRRARTHAAGAPAPCALGDLQHRRRRQRHRARCRGTPLHAFFTTKSEGMGLGLSLCRTVIEQHGGALDYGVGPGGRGTEFRFTLPAPAGGEASGEASGEAGAETGETSGSASTTA